MDLKNNLGFNENVAPSVVHHLLTELRSLSLSSSSLYGISVFYNEENLSEISAEIKGPEHTPFEQGIFRIKLLFYTDFPASPPKGYFLTKIFHPNVNWNTGEICVNVLKKDWNKSLGIKHILIVIRCLLIYPNPESALNDEAGKMLLENFEEFRKRAQVYVELYAKPEKKRKDIEEKKHTPISPMKKLTKRL